MGDQIKSDDVIFNFFKQICDEEDDKKCIDLGNSWINAMETNLNKMDSNLRENDKLRYEDDIKKNRQHLDSLKNKTSMEWREYAKLCLSEILEKKTQK